MATEDTYKIIGGQPVCGVEPGGVLTLDVIEAHGGDITFLTATGHIRKVASPSTTVSGEKPARTKKKEQADG